MRLRSRTTKKMRDECSRLLQRELEAVMASTEQTSEELRIRSILESRVDSARSDAGPQKPSESTRRIQAREAPCRMDRVTYVIQDLFSYAVKIGYTSNIVTRLSWVDTHSPSPIVLCILFRGQSERSLHWRMKSNYVHGEWFMPTQDLIDCAREQKAIIISEPVLPSREQTEALKQAWSGYRSLKYTSKEWFKKGE